MFLLSGAKIRHCPSTPFTVLFSSDNNLRSHRFWGLLLDKSSPWDDKHRLCVGLESTITSARAHSGVVGLSPVPPADWREGEVSCCSSASSDVRGDGQPGQPGEELRLPAQVPAGGRQRCWQRGDPGQPAGRVSRVTVCLQQWWVTPVSADRDPRAMMSIVVLLFVSWLLITPSSCLFWTVGAHRALWLSHANRSHIHECLCTVAVPQQLFSWHFITWRSESRPSLCGHCFCFFL